MFIFSVFDLLEYLQELCKSSFVWIYNDVIALCLFQIINFKLVNILASAFYNQFFGNDDRKYDRHIENESPGSSISKKILKIDKFKTQNLELYKSMFLANILIFYFIQLFTTFGWHKNAFLRQIEIHRILKLILL